MVTVSNSVKYYFVSQIPAILTCLFRRRNKSYEKKIFHRSIYLVHYRVLRAHLHNR
jgi:hypothetical protein